MGDADSHRKQGNDAEDGEDGHHVEHITGGRVRGKDEREEKSTGLAVEDSIVCLTVGGEDSRQAAFYFDFDPTTAEGHGTCASTMSAVLEESRDRLIESAPHDVPEEAKIGFTVGAEVSLRHFDSHWLSLVH